MPLDSTTFDSKRWEGLGPNCQLVFHLLGTQIISDIFTEPFYLVLDNCEQKILNAGPKPYGEDYIDVNNVAPIQEGLQRLSLLFRRTSMIYPNDPASPTWKEVTLRDLVTGAVTADIQVQGECARLKTLGCFFSFDHIPPGMHYRANKLINTYNFLSPAGTGSQPLNIFITSGSYRRIARIAKHAGILGILANPFGDNEMVKSTGGPIGDGNGKCCNGTVCQTPSLPFDEDDFYCELADPSDPASGCNSMADPCD